MSDEWEGQVEIGTDDAQQAGDETFSAANTVINVYRYTAGSVSQISGGLRWQNITIPQGVTILTATLSVYVQYADMDDVYCKIYGNNVDNALNFSDNPHIITEEDRPRTTDYTSWEVESTGTGWRNAPSVKDVIQEVINRGGWSSGNALVLLLIANVGTWKKFAFCSYEGQEVYAAKLSITYEGPPPNEAPTAPSSLLCEEEATPSNVTDLTPEFSAIFEDPNSGDIANAVEIHVASTEEGLDSPDLWDSGWIDISGENLVEGNRCDDQSYAGSALSLNGQTYYWKIRFRDDDDEEGAWSNVANFSMSEEEEPSNPPVITFVDVNNKTINESNPMIFGTAIRRNVIVEYSGNPLRIWNARISPSGVYAARNIELTMITTIADDPDGDSDLTPISSGREWIRNQWTSIKSNGIGGFTGSGNPPWGGYVNYDGMTDDVETIWSNIGGAQDSDYHSIGDIQPSSYREIYWRVYPPVGATLINQFIYTQARIVYEFL